MSTDTRQAHNHLTKAIAEFTRAAAEQGFVATDAVLVVGLVNITESGQRVGGVGIYTPEGGSPTFVSKGLLMEALDRCRECSCA